MFVGGLDPDVDERTLYDAFAPFGVLIAAPKVMRDEAGKSKGFAFLSYDSFEAADMAIQMMDGQWLGGRFDSIVLHFTVHLIDLLFQSLDKYQ